MTTPTSCFAGNTTETHVFQIPTSFFSAIRGNRSQKNTKFTDSSFDKRKEKICSPHTVNTN